MENTSGRGANVKVPAEIDKWNWGAFLLGWIWGMRNNTSISLLTLVPFAQVIVMLLLGAKGSAWAWQNKRWESVAQFKAVQRRWAPWGIAAWMMGIAGLAYLLFAISAGPRG